MMISSLKGLACGASEILKISLNSFPVRAATVAGKLTPLLSTDHWETQCQELVKSESENYYEYLWEAKTTLNSKAKRNIAVLDSKLGGMLSIARM